MDTEDVKRKCDSCKETVSIDAIECPHCGSRQLTSKMMISLLAVLGIMGLPFSYVVFPVALDFGVPSGIEGIAVGIAWGIVLIGPLLLLISVGAYNQRREAVQEA